MKLQTLVFDWDGTLHDTAALYGGALRETLKWLASQGYSVPVEQSDASLSRYLGVNARDMWRDFMPELPDDVKEECSWRTGENMVCRVRSGHAEMYGGAEECLRRFKADGYHLAILSNCKVPYMAAQREAFGLDRYFEEYYCSGAYDFQPKEEIFPYIRDRFPGEYCMIGDRASDRTAARENGVLFVGCRYGFGTEEELAGSDAYADSAADLCRAVAGAEQHIIHK